MMFFNVCINFSNDAMEDPSILNYIYQFRLEQSFDVSTAVKVGRWNVEYFYQIKCD